MSTLNWYLKSNLAYILESMHWSKNCEARVPNSINDSFEVVTNMFNLLYETFVIMWI